MAKMAKSSCGMFRCSDCEHCMTARTNPPLFIGLINILGTHILEEAEDSCGLCERYKMVVELTDDAPRECPYFKVRDVFSETYGGEV